MLSGAVMGEDYSRTLDRCMWRHAVQQKKVLLFVLCTGGARGGA